MSGSEETKSIRISMWLWSRLVRDLRRRGRGERESGAFLLGLEGGPIERVTSYLCYDDVDAKAYQRGAIAFHASGYAALWRHCAQRGLQVLGDVHTHPGHGVGQSHIDQRHPMLPVIGHTALILPNFADTPWWSLGAAGVYEYLGNFQWRTHPPGANRRVALTWW